MKICKIEEKNEKCSPNSAIFGVVSLFDDRPKLTVVYEFETLREEHDAYEHFLKLMEEQNGKTDK